MLKILVVDDEPHITELLQFNLEINNYDVDIANDGKEAFEKIKSNSYDLIILDIMLPYIDGIDLLKFIRRDKVNSDLPVLMLTAKNSETDKVLGLDSGADDYLTKPFSIKELVARVNALLRRTIKKENVTEDIIQIKNLKIDSNSHIVTVNNHELDLTLKEFEVLWMLCENKDNVVKRDVLLDKIWGYDFFGDTRTIDVHIRHIRMKIEEYDNQNDYIETIRGVGYKIRTK